ncbi:Iah1p [Sugiyamaella lignohabitans]|uniref:Iah1p n=1 Tax=Sugiyamaella lignohabitans TaxID=796027 RepID=A0A167F994_9ASCO|nr:Iah1p [Sugiyamaella lignohabitans]ANB14988.1 Iah1p [Sugiyamaella lignohabitans]
MVSVNYDPVSTGGKPHEIHLNRILLFGDSITQQSSTQAYGFAIAPALQDLYIRKFDVITRGFGGYTSAHGRYMIDPILQSEHKPSDKAAVELLVIFWGSNDSVVDGHIQNVPLQDYIENQKYIVRAAQAKGIKKIILVAPAAYDERLGGPDRKTSRFREYGQALKKVAAEFDLGFVDLWTEFLTSVGWKEGDPIPGETGSGSDIDLSHLLHDGLHFTGAGYEIWYNALPVFIVLASCLYLSGTGNRIWRFWI